MTASHRYVTKSMNFKPSEFFIGLVEFISILLPGAVLTMVFLAIEYQHPLQSEHHLFKYALSDEFKIIFWVIFIFSSFGLGYFLSSVASGLDPFYDFIREQTYPYEEDLKRKFHSKSPEERQRYFSIYEDSLKKPGVSDDENLTDEEKSFTGFKMAFSNNFIRKLLGLIFKLQFRVKIDYSYEETRKLLNAQPLAVRKANNAFKWAITILEAHYPSINEQAVRTMAASKFFRSMVIVSFIFLVLQLARQIPDTLWGFNALVLLLSFREYFVQRQKSVLKTYQSIVTLAYFNKESFSLPKEYITKA